LSFKKKSNKLRTEASTEKAVEVTKEASA